MTAPNPGSYMMSGKVRAIRRTTDSNRSQWHSINLDGTVVRVERVQSFGERWVAKCSYSKQKMAGMNVYGEPLWYGDWVNYEFAITDKTEVSMKRLS
jgi:hypothetical protein